MKVDDALRLYAIEVAAQRSGWTDHTHLLRKLRVSSRDFRWLHKLQFVTAIAEEDAITVRIFLASSIEL